MVSIEETEISETPQPPSNLGGEVLALAVSNNHVQSLKYINDLDNHLTDLKTSVVNLQAQLDESQKAYGSQGEVLAVPPSSESPAASPDTDDNEEIWVTEYTLSVGNTIPISKISGIVVMPRGIPPFVVVGSFSAVLERRIETKVRKRDGGIDGTEANLVRENEGDWKPVNRFIAFGDLDLDDGSCFDIIAEKPEYKAYVKVEKLRRIWKGARPRDAKGNRAKLVFEKKKSYKRDEAYLIPLNTESEYEFPCNLVCQRRQIMARPHYLGEQMSIVLRRKATKPWDPDFTINATAQTGIVESAALKAPRKQTLAQLRLPNEEGLVRKKPRLETDPEGSKSKISSVVIGDDVEMNYRVEQDELALSSDPEAENLFSARTHEHRVIRTNSSANTTPVSASSRVGEYHVVEDMMSSPTHRVPTVRNPLQVLHSSDRVEEV